MVSHIVRIAKATGNTFVEMHTGGVGFIGVVDGRRMPQPRHSTKQLIKVIVMDNVIGCLNTRQRTTPKALLGEAFWV